MTIKTLIVIFGRSESGKDTFAKHLAHELKARGKKAPIIAFADQIKEACVSIIGIPREVAFGSQEKRKRWSLYGLTAREWQQKIGDIFRDFHSDFWIHRWYNEAEYLLKTHDIVITSDGRMENETYIPRSLVDENVHVLNIMVKRPGHLAEGIDNDHITEAGVDKLDDECHLLISNEKLEDLATSAAETAKALTW